MARRIAPGYRRLLLIGIAALVLLTPAGGAAQEASGPITIALGEVDASGVQGRATLTAEGDQTRVEMVLEGPAVAGNHPTHIHTGTCASFDPNPLIPLETFVLDPVDRTGQSTTTIDASLASLQSGDYVILVHLSPEELTTYLVCGEIPQTTATGAGGASVPAAAGEHGGHAAAMPATPVNGMPVAGVGAAIGEPGSGLAIGALACGALALALGAVGLRRRPWP